MKVSPSLREVIAYQKSGQYDVVPLKSEILSDFITPIEAVRILKNASRHCYLLESAKADETWGRYSFLGFAPTLEVTCLDGCMSVTAEGKRVRQVTQHGENPGGIFSACADGLFGQLA